VDDQPAQFGLGLPAGFELAAQKRDLLLQDAHDLARGVRACGLGRAGAGFHQADPPAFPLVPGELALLDVADHGILGDPERVGRLLRRDFLQLHDVNKTSSRCTNLRFHD